MNFIHTFLEVKVAGGNDRTFIGHGSTFGNVDSYGDTVAKGAFAASIADAKSGNGSWPALMLNHAGNPIGAILDMGEDLKGLRIKCQLADTEAGNTVYELLKMKPRPALNGLSIGYVAKDFELHRTGPVKRTLKADVMLMINQISLDRIHA
jgi:HK97 family phage prohead protease